MLKIKLKKILLKQSRFKKSKNSYALNVTFLNNIEEQYGAIFNEYTLHFFKVSCQCNCKCHNLKESSYCTLF